MTISCQYCIAFEVMLLVSSCVGASAVFRWTATELHCGRYQSAKQFYHRPTVTDIWAATLWYWYSSFLMMSRLGHWSVRRSVDAVDMNKQIHLVGECFILKVHLNTTNYSYTVDVSVSDKRPKRQWCKSNWSCFDAASDSTMIPYVAPWVMLCVICQFVYNCTYWLL